MLAKELCANLHLNANPQLASAELRIDVALPARRTLDRQASESVWPVSPLRRAVVFEQPGVIARIIEHPI